MADDLADCRVTSFGGRERIPRKTRRILMVTPTILRWNQLSAFIEQWDEARRAAFSDEKGE
jgi:hypothetical protein